MSDAQGLMVPGALHHPWGSRPPTSVWPPCPPEPCGPWPSGLYRLNQCWDDVAKTKEFLARMMREIIAEDPSIIAVGTPVVGVTNGTDAQPGMVGEFKFMATGFSWPAAPATFTAFITVGSLPAGDWDCWWYFGLTSPIAGAQIYLDPLPPGFTGDMDQVLYVPGGQTTPETFFLNSPHVRALTSAATALVFAVNVAGGPSAGSGEIIFNARRSR